MMKWLSFLLVLNLSAEEVTLAWDNNPPNDFVQAYIVYEHLDDIYTPLQTVTTNRATLTNILAGERCFVVTASNFWGESVFSSEACTLVVVEGTKPLPVAGLRFL